MARRLPITDHAVLRYLERAKGIDVDGIRQHIWSICEGPAKLGATSLRAEGVKFEFTNGIVITVTPDSRVPSKTTRNAAQRKIQPL